MNYIQTEIDGVWLIEPRVFSDERGYFMEAYKKEEFEANIGPVNVIQDNYAPQAEASILYNDETLGIDWPLAESQMLLSAKDREGTAFKDAAYFE